MLPRVTKRTHEEAGGLIVISETRLNKILKNWDQNNINLLRSPPASGKTTLAKVLTKSLESRGYVVKYITLAHWRKGEFPDLLSDNGSFDAFWRKEIQCTWSECANNPRPVYVLIDEAQVLYGGSGTLDFWNDVKFYTDHPKDGFYVLLLSMYEARNPRDIDSYRYTPIEFSNPMGLDELRLREDEFKELERNFIAYIDKEEEALTIPDDISESIYNATRGHPHLVRRTLGYLQRQFQRGFRGDDLRRSMISYDYFLEIQRTRVFDWMTNWDPTPLETRFLQTAYDTLDDDSTFAIDTGGDMLETLQRLTHSGLVTYSGSSRLQFAAPVVRIILGKRLYTSPLTLDPISGGFEDFLQNSIARMRPSDLRKSLIYGINTRLYERAWQKV